MPQAPSNVTELEALLSAPDDATTHALATLDGDVLILGAGGKMGPTVARMARRAIADATRRVIAVSRFTSAGTEAALRAAGVDTIRADLADPTAVAALPDAPNVLWMAGQKFGTTNDPVGTWTQNVVASVHAAERYAGSRVVCFSTGNVYPRTEVAAGGSHERDTLAPVGEYAASCVGRERVFEAVARRAASPLLLYRLFYACDLRYGVVTDIAQRVLTRTPIDLAMGYANVIWQGDANRLALRALGVAASPPVALNVSGRMVQIRDVAEMLGGFAGIAPIFLGEEREDALLANVDALAGCLPYTPLPLDVLCEWAIAWLAQGGVVLNKPTRFETRDGTF